MGIMLQVENLSAQVTDEDLIVRFGDYGIVESATMNQASSDLTAYRSACVVMANSEEAQAAIDWLHDTPFKGNTISVCHFVNIRERVSWFHLDLPRLRGDI
jgi:RNA recognition motif-containing protein